MMHTFCNNVAAMSWQQKGSTTMEKAAASLLLQEATHQQCKHGYVPNYQHISGETNVMADDASRL
jgi:hypothetical protein